MGVTIRGVTIRGVTIRELGTKISEIYIKI